MVLEFDRPDRCVIGTVGSPGNRLFLLQVTQGSRLAAVAIEKQQAHLLGVRVGEVLEQLSHLGYPVPPPGLPSDMGPLDAPVKADFRAAAIGMAWDSGQECLVLELFSDDFAQGDDGTLLQVRLTPAMAREFSSRAAVIVASGRPACPACAQPLDPGGHICPRANGYRRDLFE